MTSSTTPVQTQTTTTQQPTTVAATTKTAAGPAFSVSSLNINPAEVRPDEPVSVSVTVTNTGGTEGTFTVYFKVNGEVMESKVVTLPGGVSDIITFTTIAGTAGDYSVEIGSAKGNFSVVQPGLLWLWLALGLGMPSLALVVAFMTYRIRKAE